MYPARTLALALTVALASTATALGKTTVYAGSTSGDDNPLVLRVAKKRVVGLSIMWRASCQSGRTFSFGDTVTPGTPIPIRAGRFSGSIYVPQDLGSDGTGAVTLMIKGTVTKSKLTGSFTGALAVGSDPTGPSDTCVVVDEPFTLAHRPGRVFAGTTSQRLPVVLEVPASRKVVRHLHIGWRAPCTSGASFQIGDFLKDFSVSGGRFGDNFTQLVNRADGGTVGLIYKVAGRLARTSANGSIWVAATWKDAAGTIEDQCQTSLVTFKATT